jgi:hypothetical protein
MSRFDTPIACHHARFGAYQAVLHTIQIDITAQHIAVAVLGADIPQRGPGADVGGHHGGMLGVFHHRIVDEIGRAGG